MLRTKEGRFEYAGRIFRARGERSVRPEGLNLAACTWCWGRDAVGAAIAAAATRAGARLQIEVTGQSRKRQFHNCAG